MVEAMKNLSSKKYTGAALSAVLAILGTWLTFHSGYIQSKGEKYLSKLELPIHRELKWYQSDDTPGEFRDTFLSSPKIHLYLLFNNSTEAQPL